MFGASFVAQSDRGYAGCGRKVNLDLGPSPSKRQVHLQVTQGRRTLYTKLQDEPREETMTRLSRNLNIGHWLVWLLAALLGLGLLFSSFTAGSSRAEDEYQSAPRDGNGVGSAIYS